MKIARLSLKIRVQARKAKEQIKLNVRLEKMLSADFDFEDQAIFFGAERRLFSVFIDYRLQFSSQ